MKPRTTLSAVVLAAGLGLSIEVATLPAFGQQPASSGTEGAQTPATAPPAAGSGTAGAETPATAPPANSGTTPPASSGTEGAQTSATVPPAGAPGATPPAGSATGATGTEGAYQPLTDSSGQPIPGAVGPATGPGADQPGNFTNPYFAVHSFLNALRVKNVDGLAEAVALHAPSEAREANKKLFGSLLDASVAAETIDNMASELDGFQIIGNNMPKSTGLLEVIIAKEIPPAQPGVPGGGGIFGARITRVITVRREQAGWKVQDISPARSSEIRPANTRRRR